MKLLKWLFGTVAVLAALLVGGGLLLPSTFSVTRSAALAAAPEQVWPLLADPRAWAGWSVWHRRDPAMKISYSGAASGAGAVWSWQSQREGDGTMTFTAAEPGRRLAYELFFPDFGTVSKGEFTLSPEGAGTRVTWRMDGDMGRNPAFRWIALFADRMVGGDFEAGLEGLRQQAERR